MARDSILTGLPLFSYFSVDIGAAVLPMCLYLPEGQHGGGDSMLVQYHSRSQRYQCSCWNRHTDNQTLLHVRRGA